MSGMALSAELSAAVLFLDNCFDCSELRVEKWSCQWWWSERMYFYRSEGFGASAEGLFGSVHPASMH